jgi:hypothetical protein
MAAERRPSASVDAMDGTANRRGSAEAIAKRRAARHFNAVLSGAHVPPALDGRTAKRRDRLLKELADGARGGRPLKPIEILTRAQELFELGESLGSLRKVAKVRPLVADDDSVREAIAALHEAYAFRVEAYQFLGLSDDVLRAAGVLGEGNVARVRRTRRSGSGDAGGVDDPARRKRRSTGLRG